MQTINNSLRAKRLNSYVGNKRPTVKAIVLHDTAGSGTVNDATYLANDPDNRKISVDYVILRDGTVYKLNPDLTRYTTNHAGRDTYLRTLSGLPIGTNIRNANVNGATVGVELSHNVVPSKQTPEWPDEQIQAVAELCKSLCSVFNLTRDDITTHAKIITDGSRTDPRNFPWPVFWAAFGAVPPDVDGNVPLPVTATSGEEVFHTVIAGDTIWGLAIKYHTTIEAIKALNGIDTPSTLITVGQRLLVSK